MHKVDDLDWLARQARDLYHTLDRYCTHSAWGDTRQKAHIAKNRAFARWQRRARALRQAIKEEHGK